MSKWQPFKQKGRSKGVTLIELIVALSLSVIIITSLYYVFNTSFQSYKLNSSKAEINQNARIALERITRDLRQTSTITTVLPPTDTDQLNPPPDNIQFQNGHDQSKIEYIKYYLSNNELHRQEFHYYFSTDTNQWVAYNAKDQYNNPPLVSTPVDTVKADKVTSLKFFGTSMVNIVLTTAAKGQTQVYETQVLGRNI